MIDDEHVRSRDVSREGGRPRPRVLAAAVAAAMVAAAAAAVALPGLERWQLRQRCRSGASVDDATLRQCLALEAEGAFEASERNGRRIVEAAIRAAPATVPMFDGRAFDVWAYNGQVPGPTLRVRRGDTLRVHFTNGLPQPTTIHWHGVRVPNAMDGVPGVTQEPVQPGQTFVYEFTPREAGTFWFHPHLRSSEQVERGLYGVLIVEDEAPAAHVEEMIWVLDDWLLDGTGRLRESFITRSDLAHDGRWGNVVTVSGKVRPRFSARPGQRLRIRAVDVANGRVFALDFGELRPQIIAQDGMYLPQPRPASRVELAPGNRADFDLVIPSDAVGRTFVIHDRFTRTPIELASITVEGEAVATPPAGHPSGTVPAWAEASRLAPDHELRLNARAGGPYGIEWTINAAVMRHDEPGHHHHEAPYRLDAGRFAKIRFINDSARLHPMHIHGMFFKVLARSGSPVDEPAWRDTVLMRPRESIDIGVVPVDLGRWMLHCHILEHADSGMMTLVEVR
ncbi:MAG TPA: multicopper oxidase family protein [Candidatus Limnocylindrales bacterium]|nr:multicopper oxidase family protein [Candidatus Limnocylindrales bacterium]